MGKEGLNVFIHDPEYEKHKEIYQDPMKELLGKGSSGESEDGSSHASNSDKEDNCENEDTSALIINKTKTNRIASRRSIYLTIQSFLDFEDTVHRLMKLNIKPGHEPQLCHVIINCGAQQRTYETFSV